MPSHDPIARFQDTFARASVASTTDPTAMTLATADGAGRPSARVVLLKSVDARGFVFYSNRESRKGRDIVANPRAALGFYWPALGEQVRVEGDVVLVSDEESDAYFASRPRESQLGAWASQQSRPVASREDLLAAVRAVETRFPPGVLVPRPPYWGGFRVVPSRIEFWKDGAFRIHDREVYLRDGAADGWRKERLYP